MQKLIQRSERASRVAARQKTRAREQIERGEKWERFQMRNRMQRTTNENIREARNNRRQDWLAGPLAPRRDVGDKTETYGALPMYDLHPPDKEEKDYARQPVIAQGDRVVIVKGREKGRISTVMDVNLKRASVRVKDVNTVDIAVPEWIQREEGDNRPVVPHTRGMPLDYVKLVYPLPDPETGVPRDVIIDRLERVKLLPNVYARNPSEYKASLRTARKIPGTNTIIPWPHLVSDPDDDPSHEDDTPRITVDEKTFRPYLLYPPMPMSVIDELRNKYSKFRTRHDYDYVQRKEAEDEREERRKNLGKTMRTPLQDLAEMRSRQRLAEERELSDEQLGRIGEVMAREQARAKLTVAAR